MASIDDTAILDFPTLHETFTQNIREQIYILRSQFHIAFIRHCTMMAKLLQILTFALLVVQNLGHRVHQPTISTTEKASSRITEEVDYYDDDHLEVSLQGINVTSITESPMDALPMAAETTYTIFGYECTIQR